MYLCKPKQRVGTSMRLSELQTGHKAYIIRVNGSGAFRKRILEMGFVRGQEVRSVLNAPLKDPIKYEIMEYEVSLRRSEAVMVEISVLEADAGKNGAAPDDLLPPDEGEHNVNGKEHPISHDGEPPYQQEKNIRVARGREPECG